MKLNSICTIFVAAASSAAAFSPSSQPMTRSVANKKFLPAPSSSSYTKTIRSPSRLHSSSDEVVNDFDDFAEFSSTQLQNNEEDNGGGDTFLSSLQSRMQQVQNESNRLVSE